MPELRITLIGEGTSDDALLPIIERLVRQMLSDAEIRAIFVSTRDFPPEYSLTNRIVASFRDRPCDLLFVHRDADSPSPSDRRTEVLNAVHAARTRDDYLPSVVAVVPVREQEAWLLVDHAAIRQAAGRPRSTDDLDLPRVHEIESCLDPKARLRQALRTASGLPHRRLHKADSIRRRDVAELIEDISPLRQLSAFRAFEGDVRQVIEAIRNQG